jgi:hypothetical protein
VLIVAGDLGAAQRAIEQRRRRREGNPVMLARATVANRQPASAPATCWASAACCAQQATQSGFPTLRP